MNKELAAVQHVLAHGTNINDIYVKASFVGNKIKQQPYVNTNPDHLEIEKKTILHYAVAKKNYDLVKFLIKNGITIDRTNYQLHTPLHYAIDNNDYPTTKLLLDSKANPNKVDHSLVTATRFYSYPTVQILMHAKCNIDEPDFSGNTSFHYGLLASITKKQHNMMKILLHFKCNINTLNNTNISPLNIAVKLNAVKHINILLSAKVQIDGWAFNCAVEKSSMQTIKTLIDAGAELNPEGDYPLKYAIARSQICTRLLIESKADVNINNSLCKAPLYYTFKRPSTYATKYLISKKADVNCLGYTGQPVLTYVVANGMYQYLDILIDAKANINAKTIKGGNTALHYAYNNNDKNVIKTLLKAKADPNIKNNSGQLPSVCQKQDEPVVKKKRLKK